MKTLPTLIKMQKMRVDEQRQLLAKLQDNLAAIEQRMVELEIEKAREQAIAQEDETARAGLGSYLKSAIEKGRALEKERQVMQAAVDTARDELMQIFEEQKRYEIAEAARLAVEQAEEKHRECLDLDEVGSTRFARQKDKP